MASVVGAALDDLVGAARQKGKGKADQGYGAEEKANIELEIQELKAKVRMYELREREVDEHKARLEGLLAKQQDDQKDIFQYLNGELAKKADDVAKLEKDVERIIADNDRGISEKDRELQQLQDAADQESLELKQEISHYKEELEKQLREKKRQLNEDAKRHETLVSDLERKHVQEKDRLKKEMLLKLRETKANLLKMTDNQLDTTTKRTIAENEQMSSELAWQSKETEKLIRKNDKLTGENAALKRELQLHSQTQEQFAKKARSY
jgi:hypothetical protein